MSYDKINFVDGHVLTADQLNHMESGIERAIPNPDTAAVGQTIRVSAVDDSGKPTAWEAVDFPTGGGGGGGVSEWETIFDETIPDDSEGVTGLTMKFPEEYDEFIVKIHSKAPEASSNATVYPRVATQKATGIGSEAIRGSFFDYYPGTKKWDFEATFRKVIVGETTYVKVENILAANDYTRGKPQAMSQNSWESTGLDGNPVLRWNSIGVSGRVFLPGSYYKMWGRKLT